MNALFAVNPRWSGAGLTLLRLATGAVFAVHGYQKLFVMGFAGVSGAFGHMGAPMPGFTGPLFGILEFFGGLAIILGFLTRLDALWFILDMLGAIAIVHMKNGWSGPMGLELPLMLLTASIALFFNGPGAFAVDNLIARRGSNTVTP